MVTNRTEHSGKTPVKQGFGGIYREPNKIGASTPFDFSGTNLTPYGGLLAVATMLEKLGFQAVMEETVTVKRLTKAMSGYQFLLAMVLGLYIGFSRLNQLRFIARDPILTGILKIVQLPPQSTLPVHRGGAQDLAAGGRVAASELEAVSEDRRRCRVRIPLPAGRMGRGVPLRCGVFWRRCTEARRKRSFRCRARCASGQRFVARLDPPSFSGIRWSISQHMPSCGHGVRSVDFVPHHGGHMPNPFVQPNRSVTVTVRAQALS